MRRCPRPLALALVCLGGLAAAAVPTRAADEQPADRGGGPVYRDAEAGVRVVGPKGWRLNAEGVAPLEWTRLATWFEPESDADAVLSVRKRSSTNVQAMLTRVRDEWARSRDITVTATRAIEPTPGSPVGQVVVDGTYIVRPKPPAGSNPSVPPPPVPYRMRATYWLAPRGEYLLYVTARQTFWSRLAEALRLMESSVQFEGETASTPKGAGTYRDDKYGFACRFPQDHTVLVPSLRNQLVEFAGVSEDDPSYGIYVMGWERPLAEDVRRLQAFYEEEQGGETHTTAITLAGQEATVVEARARVGGRDTIALLAAFKRGSDRLFRIKASAPASREAELREGMRVFLDGFKLTQPSR